MCNSLPEKIKMFHYGTCWFYQKVSYLNSWFSILVMSVYPLPPGKRLHNYRKSAFLLRGLTLSMAIFNSYLRHYQRVNLRFPMVLLWFSYGFAMVFLWFSHLAPWWRPIQNRRQDIEIRNLQARQRLEERLLATRCLDQQCRDIHV